MHGGADDRAPVEASIHSSVFAALHDGSGRVTLNMASVALFS